MQATSATISTPSFITDWLATLAEERLDHVVRDPAQAAVFCTDMTIGFCDEGPLASDRVDNLTEPVVAFFQRCWDHGIRDFVLPHDTHTPDNPEFRSWPPHCVRGTREAQSIPELDALPFSNQYTIIEKNSLNPAIETGFDAWLDEHPEIGVALVAGNCTDLCVYQLAMHLRMRANAKGLTGFDVVVPTEVVETFDIPPEAAQEGAFGHPAQFFHDVFLFHMAMNGIRIVRSLI
jgi:nicotinamidase-related amidase